jgi:hypothetical protein
MAAFQAVIRVGDETLAPGGAPTEVSTEIRAAVLSGMQSGSVEHEGAEYQWELVEAIDGSGMSNDRNDGPRVLPEWMRTPTGA